MFYRIFVILILAILVVQEGCGQELLVVTSPSNKVSAEFSLKEGTPYYRLLTPLSEVITYSRLGFTFKNQSEMSSGFELINSHYKNVDNRWQTVWGESAEVKNRYQELTVLLREKIEPKRDLILIFRAYDDGIGFRYVFPEQSHLSEFFITSEETEFNFIDNHTAWWTPADYDSYEALYRKTALSEVKAVNTPITMKTASGLFLSVHEAALTNYAGMTLAKNETSSTSSSSSLHLKSNLVPWPDGIKVKGKTPFKTPWRTIQVADTAGGLIESDLIVNLNEPNAIEDTSWIKPMKYIGIWWGMHMRKYTWEAGPKHGATTENTKNYIDFAKAHNIGGVLVEGWNKGWETWHSDVNIQDFTQAYDDFDLEELAEYGRKNNVQLIGHHETGGNVPLYEEQISDAFKLYQKVGVHAIKTGYAGKMQPQGVYHHSQPMVEHYRKVVELAAKHQIMVNAHEPIKPTGIRRTYPNMMTREGGRGMEWNGWSEGNPPEHTVTLPFTRLLAGPMDYTPGIFDLKFDPQEQYRVHSTLAKQLAMFVTLYSPMQMAADMIENYQYQPAFEFIEKVPTSWDETKVLSGEVGDYITMARRSGKHWYLGAMTDEHPRKQDIILAFLDDDISYIARIFADGEEIDFHSNPTSVDIVNVSVKKGDVLTIAMAPGGGQALYIIPEDEFYAEFSQDNFLQTTSVDVNFYNKHVNKVYSNISQGKRYGEITKIEHLAKNKSITTLSPFDRQYSGGSENTLVDGLLGGSDYKTLWQGYRKNDLDVVIDLGSIQYISHIEIGFMQSQLHSILLPSEIEFFTSKDKKNYTLMSHQHYHTTKDVPDYQVKRFSTIFSPQVTRFIRVKAKNVKNLPKWHIRAGQETFIFADEVIVK